MKTSTPKPLTSYLFLLSAFFLLPFISSAQKWAVYFTDKNNTPYSIENPEAFLSQRAIDRRARHGITVDAQDLPVDPVYVQQVQSLGAEVPYTSKWLNCALVSCSPAIKSQIEQLPFVSQVIYISPDSYGGKSAKTLSSNFSNKLEKEDDFIILNPEDIETEYLYGEGFGQINQLNGIPVHEQGFAGEGVLIAVLDAGFENVNLLSVFSNLYSEGRLVFEMDVVKPNGNIYAANTSNHGTTVLSCMAAYTNDSFVGTAPEASYALIRTEDAATEYLVECYNWVVGAEAADSIGSDIINTSLGYTTFDDPSMNYTYSQMDGETPVASFAAKTAIEKGVFVTASAGNNNGPYSTWPWMGSPGDTKYAASIGAVDNSGIIASFSSLGPNGAGIPKPNTLAMGVSATVYSTSGNISTASGTSFSSPITCGMYACLIQANPNIRPATLRDIVDETGDRFPNHDNAYGYGIPNFAAALENVLSFATMEIIEVAVNDSQGNNNGQLNPGETVSIIMTVKNNSSESLNDVSAVVSINNPLVTIINNTAGLGNFSPNETKIANNAFTFSLSESAIPNSTLQFDVIFTYGNQTVQGFFTVDIYENPPPPPLHAPQYAVYFKDKNNTPYSIENPLEFLSQKAIDRRNKYGITITEDDLPVNLSYIQTVNQKGAYVRGVSRWSNSVLVYAEEEMINTISNLDFVDKIVFVKPAEGKCLKYDPHPKWMNETFGIPFDTRGEGDYGVALAQIKQLNGVVVHNNGYKGEGVLIAVLDGGFANADKVNVFKHLFDSDKIVWEENVVEKDQNIYAEDISGHGTAVLSCMGSNISGEFIGTAPAASYALIRTEDVATEYLIEEYFWMIGAERADYIGADIINSSLGYTSFDDPSMSHTYSDLDGKTAISSIAATMAVERGVFVTNSAGNSNGSSSTFPWVGSPADAPEALALGAVNISGEIASFSSLGPNGAGYPKPDVVACGWDAYLVTPYNTISTGSGTSFASPITCGMVACVIQAAPTKTPQQILDAIQKSANRYPEHDDAYGYGIPDFAKVLQLLDVEISVNEYNHPSFLEYYPNPVNDKLFLSNVVKKIATVEIYDMKGRLLKNVAVGAFQTSINMKGLNSGLVFVKIIYEEGAFEMVKCVIGI